MPELTEIQLARNILAARVDLPIIMCTGFSYLVDADKASAAGIKAFAIKPSQRGRSRRRSERCSTSKVDCRFLLAIDTSVSLCSFNLW
ncbi:MAG: hypothetical protein ABSD38_31695 [Syntrophorhabdales bacterium]